MAFHWGFATMQNVSGSERVHLHRSQTLNLQSTQVGIHRTTANVAILTWRQKLQNQRWNKQGWNRKYNPKRQIVSLGKTVGTKINLQLQHGLRYPQKKSMISFLIYLTQNHERSRTMRTLSHGLSDEEKKNTSDNFELHLELGDMRNIAVVLIGFSFPKRG